MTKTHFEAIAAIINYRRSEADDHLANMFLVSVARDLADYFASENPRFDRDKFLTACGF